MLLERMAELLLDLYFEFVVTHGRWVHVVNRVGRRWRVTVEPMDDLAYMVQEETMLGVPV